MSNPSIEISQRRIGLGHPAYIIAEMSANHGQSFEQAVQLVRAASDAGADAIKLQTYTPDTITIDCDNEHFRIGKGTLWEGRNLYGLYAEAHTPWDWQPKLLDLARDLGLHCFSSPFDLSAVEFLQRLDIPAYKIASFELVDLPLIRAVARTGKPVIISTGMASLAEIDEAVRAFRVAGGSQLALLKCTSAYPSPPGEMNLRTIPHLAQAFGVPAGLSDHTLGFAVPVAAVTLGACIIEKHLTLSRSAPGPDSAFSLEPQEFRAMVEAIRATEQALGRVSYDITEGEAASRVFRRSLFVVQDMQAGDLFTGETVRSIRPAYGLHTRHLEEVLGHPALRAIPRGTPLSWDMVGAEKGSGAR
jgi:N-acetylneuraminate synthase